METTGINELSNVSKVSRDAKVMGEEIKLKKELEELEIESKIERENKLKEEVFKICSKNVRFLFDGFDPKTSGIVQFLYAQRDVYKKTSKVWQKPG